MLVYGCGVSQYPHLYYQELKKNQVLPRQYLEYFEGCPGGKRIK